KSQLVEVPDITAGRLLLTGLIVSGRVPNSPNEEALASNADARPAVRRFRAGMDISYALLVLNSSLERNTQKTRLTSQVIVYREGKSVYSGPERPLEPGKGVDPRRMIVSGQINLGALMVPGEYVLEVVVNDVLAADKKYQRASRWLDFDVVE